MDEQRWGRFHHAKGSRHFMDITGPPPSDDAFEDVFSRPTPDRPPGVVITHIPAHTKTYIGSPGILALSTSAYLAKNDIFGPATTEHECAVTDVHRSDDAGRSWRKVARIHGLFWASLFEHRGAVYLIGPSKHHGPIVIFRSDDEGTTWSQPRDACTGLLTAGGEYHTAPVPVIEHDGRLWRAMEDAMGGRKWGRRYRAMMMSAPVDADLLRRDSWTFSNAIHRDPSWLSGKFNGWLEGNAVVAPGGRIANVLRVDYNPEGGKAAIVTVSGDGRSATFEPKTGLIDFPGGCKKFTIRFDPVTGQHWSLVNWVPPRHRECWAASTRNTLALTCSLDLRSWEVRRVLLYHPDVRRHGFQYVDWLFEGEDIIVASRTAYDDGLGGAHNAHDANYLTFHRFRRWRDAD